MTDLELITRVKEEQDSGALTELVNRHTGIYTNMVQKYSAYPDFTNKIDVKDVLEEKQYNIYKWALSYDAARKMKFGTYVGEMSKYLCLDVIYRGTESVPFNEDTAVNNDTTVEETTATHSSIDQLLSEVEASESVMFKRIVKLKLKDRSWRTIGKMVGMSHEGARKLYEKHIGAVREHLKT